MRSVKQASFFVAVIAAGLLATVSREALCNEKASALLNTCPAFFVEDDAARFVHRGNGANVFLSDEIVFQLVEPCDEGTAVDAFRVTFPGARTVIPEGMNKSDAQFNYYIGNDPMKWSVGREGYEKVAYRGLYPGIDLVVHGLRSHLKYEFIVAPGADYRLISVAYGDILGLSLRADGSLRVRTTAGDVIEDAPYIYQMKDGARVHVAGEYRLLDDYTYTFSITGDYDHSAALVIDPDLAWSTFLGGAGEDFGRGLALDADGNFFVSGQTASADFPASGSWDSSYNYGSYDGYVAKFYASGTLAWATYLGGTGLDKARTICTDNSGNAYVTGWTTSTDFPVTPNGWDKDYGGGTDDGFVAKFSGTGTLEWATYLGGSLDDKSYGTAFTPEGEGYLYVAGGTASLNFPTPNGKSPVYKGGTQDVYVTKWTLDGSLVWGTYVGGSAFDEMFTGIAADDSGNVYLAGHTKSLNFPTPNGWDTSHYDDDNKFDAYVLKMRSDSEVLWATYLGGNQNDGVSGGIGLDSSRNVYVGGYTASSNFPTTPNVWDREYNGGDNDVFVAKFSNAGSLIWSTFLGGSSNENACGFTVDASGSPYVVGYTSSNNLPTSNGWDTSYNGGTDAYAARFSTTGSLIWATYLGGTGIDEAYDICVDGSGNGFIGGRTAGLGFPPPATGSYNGGTTDAYVLKFTPTICTLSVQSTPSADVSITGEPAGTTDYSADLIEGTEISLTAPPSINRSGIDCPFLRWTVAGQAQTELEATVTFYLSSDTTAVAAYQGLVETVFPAEPTACPAVETECPPAATSCPPVVATVCPELSTSCPILSTSCPPAQTECPVVATSCPSVNTSCPSSATSCPILSTSCPPAQTACPEIATSCPPADTACPPVTTICPILSTSCPSAQTACPVVATSCPPAETNCPPVETACPPVATICPQPEFHLSLKAGNWNLVSLPVEPNDPSPASVFGPNLMAVYAWTNGTGPYYVPTTITAKTGYWVAVASDTERDVPGVQPPESTVHLVPGWNLVGPRSDSAVPPGVLAVYGWDWPDGLPRYVEATECLAGRGYWVATSGEADIW